MKTEEIIEVANEYQEQERLEKLYREDKERRIKELEEMISSSLNAPIYKKLYKPEFGDYGQFVEAIARELRERTKSVSEEHIHIPNDYGGHATFSSTPTEETINAVNKMTELAFKNIK